MTTGILKGLGAMTIFATAIVAMPAQAAFVMVLDDPNDNLAGTTIYDGTGSDLNGVEGVITYSGNVGAFTVNVTTGVSKPAIGPGALDLNSINVSGAAGTLLVSISDTDFQTTDTAYQASFGGTTSGSVDLAFLYDNANQAFGGTAFASDSFSAGVVNDSFANQRVGNVSAGVPFSLTISTRIQHDDANQVTSFDAAIAPVPLPASVWLLGSALSGLGMLRRRHKS